MASHLSRNEKEPTFKNGNYGIPDAMIYGGPAALRSDRLISIHPVEAIDRKFDDDRMRMDFAMLKGIQGTQAPMRLKMEREAASKIQRLPFLPSSNLMLDTLDGNDEVTSFRDIFNVPAESEVMINPHLAMEKFGGFI